VLQQSDVGPGYQQFAEGRTGRVELSSALEGDPRRFGRQDGWTARYRSVSKRRGLLTLFSTVDVFGATSGAEDFYDTTRKRADESGKLTGIVATEAPSLGDESFAVATERSRRGAFKYFVYTWRRGRYVAMVAASGISPQPTAGAVTGLARKQANRIDAAR
jgi:hypothetical protein